MKRSLAPANDAPQHGRAPRPLPLFLHFVAEAAKSNPELARRALTGLAAYRSAPEMEKRASRPQVARVDGATLRDCGGAGSPLLLIPSLINPPEILDLDRERSFAVSMAALGNHVLLLDWGPAEGRRGLDVAGHVAELLVPLIRSLASRPALLGYCLGGTMALAAAQLTPVRRVATIAAPWIFSAYPKEAREGLTALLRETEATARTLGAMPVEVLQHAFWSLDPLSLVRKFAAFGSIDPASGDARRFVALEGWSNSGEPLPLPSARELIQELFGRDVTGKDRWQVQGRPISADPGVPALHLTASADRIAPAAAAPPGERIAAECGHVGLVIGREARAKLHPVLGRWLAEQG